MVPALPPAAAVTSNVNSLFAMTVVALQVGAMLRPGAAEQCMEESESTGACVGFERLIRSHPYGSYITGNFSGR